MHGNQEAYRRLGLQMIGEAVAALVAESQAFLIMVRTMDPNAERSGIAPADRSIRQKRIAPAMTAVVIAAQLMEAARGLFDQAEGTEAAWQLAFLALQDQAEVATTQLCAHRGAWIDYDAYLRQVYEGLARGERMPSDVLGRERCERCGLPVMTEAEGKLHAKCEEGGAFHDARPQPST